jgi:hypothetical protein
MATPNQMTSASSVRPVLELSGTKLRVALERLVDASDSLGGVERFAAAVQLKSTVFQERLADGRVRELAPSQFDEIVPLMATVRRRIGTVLTRLPWATVRSAMTDLLDGAHDTTMTDRRISAFEDALSSPSPRSRGEGRGERFLRDLAAELLHNTLPEHYPLMHRWVWDQNANTGVIRQIWHDPNGAGDEVDHVVIDVADGYETHLMLREELSQFLADNGVFRDMLWHVDLLCAQIYGDYVSAQGGAYLKADFVSEADPLEHTRRILGLDRIARKRAVVGVSDREIVDAGPSEPPPRDLSIPRPHE